MYLDSNLLGQLLLLGIAELSDDSSDDADSFEPANTKKPAAAGDDSSSSGGSSSDESSKPDKKKKKGEAAAAAPDAKAKAKALPKSKRQKRETRPLLTFDDVPAEVYDPLVLWDVQRTFTVAVQDKMASFVVSSPTGDEDVASLLEKGFEEHQEDERVMKLPWQQVVKDMKFQAAELKKWLNRINNWQLHKNLETKPERECLEQTFAAFDKAMEQVKRYELTLDTFNSEKKDQGQALKDKRKGVVDRVFFAMRMHNVPAGIAKVMEKSSVLFFMVSFF